MIFTFSKIIPTALCALLLSASSISALPPGSDAPGYDNQIRWQKLPEWQINSGAIDMVHSLGGRRLYVLTDRKEVKIFGDETSTQGQLLGTIPVASGMDKIDISPDGSTVYLLNSKSGAVNELSVTFHKDFDLATTPMKGDKNAPVSIVVFTDFQCPFCNKLPPVLDEVLQRNKGKVNLYFKNMPLITIHPQAENAARAVVAAGDQGKFWEMHDLLFNSDSLDSETIEGFAKKLNLDIERFEEDVTSNETTNKLRADLMEGQLNGVNGTPSIFIDGWPLGNRSLEGFQTMIDSILKEKKHSV
ncbi:thioredoxin domain-containing protein [Desulforhopalus vacuolatus]|uniref:thioredoxin domain-containing protein n=1 Tax=Desulforhopalus vacuolatus TaxID=40414 RepID=UPI0019649937|nr:thioredoxin domain-containing protein [Desulforhopalus vacuolatus]MBM9519777.1 thioredoxin domain-containing protein [Desulforhopalus vacuolatus]